MIRRRTAGLGKKWDGTMRTKSKFIPYLLLMPAFLLVCIFKVYPVLLSQVEGFTFNGHFSLKTYQSLFADKSFWNSLWVTVKFNIVTIPLQIFIAFCLALLVNVSVKGIGIFRTIYYLPFAISTTVAAMLWGLMFNYNSGVINSFLKMIGVGMQGFLISEHQALWCIVILVSWRGCGYWMMFFLAGLKNIDPALYEAAKVDGASWFTVITKITIPLLKRVMLFVAVANTTSNMLLFAPMQLITNGGPKNSTNVLMYEAYKSAFRYANRPRSSAIVSILLVMIVLVAVFQFLFLGEEKEKPEKRRRAR